MSDMVTSDFELPDRLRRRLIGENYGPIVVDVKPFGCEKGACYVLDWQRELKTVDRDTGEVVVADRMPLRWIRVRNVIRRTDLTWEVRFDVHDRRSPSLMLKRGGGYTTDPLHALDREAADLEPADLQRYAVEARAARAKQAEERQDDERRRQLRHLRARIAEALDGLPPHGQVLLLAAIEKLLAEAIVEEREAA